jgi:DNA-binding NtrC family response regulator
VAKILVIDDEKDFREGLAETLSDLGYEPCLAANAKDGLNLLDQHSFRAIFTDYRMPGIDGLKAISLIREKTDSPIVMITAFVDSKSTITAMRLGAFDHLTKPVGRKDVARIMGEIEKAFPAGIKAEARAASSDILLGNSPQIREVLKRIGRVAAADSSVLILGATGTGKEVVARAIHANSDRQAKPFVAVNCAAIPEALLESELFGHVKGAFTGAATDRKGSFQRADGGTLFLDEIGDMPLPLQAKILRAVQEREVIPVGGSFPQKIDVRFLAATHQNLRRLVEEGGFREDLFYRLNVVEIALPSLSERSGDIALLAQHFLNGSGKRLSEEAERKLITHQWPGNIRELKNAIERAVVSSRGAIIQPEDLQLQAREIAASSDSLNLPDAVAKLERALIERALGEAKGNRSEAARKLGIQRQLLYTKMKDYFIDLS